MPVHPFPIMWLSPLGVDLKHKKGTREGLVIGEGLRLETWTNVFDKRNTGKSSFEKSVREIGWTSGRICYMKVSTVFWAFADGTWRKKVCNGVPLLAWPVMAEQPLNVKLEVMSILFTKVSSLVVGWRVRNGRDQNFLPQCS